MSSSQAVPAPTKILMGTMPLRWARYPATALFYGLGFP
jgi:hypothetical protein